ncbi:MAG: hypothetical protein LDLANPLL_00220 [Turneriella sp.]|nr:hypothetical protein [Turneriella sp.]
MKRIAFFVAFSAILFSLQAGTTKFQKEILQRHNTLRAKHGVAPLKWSTEVEKVAQDWATKIAREDNMRHRNPNKYGENIFWMSGREPTGNNVVDAWYNEIKDYNYSNPGFSMKTGHFTQVIWKGSTELGCGSARSARGGVYVVCNYNPPGNYMGRFPENVPKTKR